MKQKFNNCLYRVQIGRHVEVPIETADRIWLLWINGDDWDADQLNHAGEYIDDLKNANLIFAVWHGDWRTNLFLMEKEDLIKRLEGRIKNSRKKK